MPGQVNGTFGQEEVRLENAATESTLMMLVVAMDKLSQKIGKEKGSQAHRLQELYNVSIKEGKTFTEKNTKAVKESEKEQKRYNDTLTSTIEKMGKVIGAVDTWTRTVSLGFEKMFSGATPTVEGFTSAFNGVPIVGGLISTFGKVLGDQITVFRDLSSSGIDLGNSLFSAKLAAAEAGLPLDTFGKVLAENSGNLALFGGSAGEGARRFTDISKNLRRSGFDKQLANLGFSMEEVASHTASYLAQQTMLGRAQSKTNEELAAETQDYLLELDKLARVHGMSRKELEKGLEANKSDLRMKALMLSMDKKTADALDRTLATVKDADMKEAIMEMVATGGVPMKSELAKGMAIFSPALKQASADLRSGSISQEQFNEVMRAESARFEQEMRTNGSTIARMKAAGVDVYDFQIKMAGTYKNFGRELAAETEAQKKARESSEKAAAGIDRTLTDLKNAFAKAFIETGLLDKISAGLSLVVEKLGVFIKDVMDFDLSTALANLFDPAGAASSADENGDPVKGKRNIFDTIGAVVGTSIKSLFENPKTYMYLAAGIAALFAGAVVKKALVDSVSNMVGSAASKFTMGKTVPGGAGAGAGGAGGAGSAGGNILSGIGKGTGDILRGLAGGISAFANPKVALGAAGLGLAITAIGAGIAGAAWIMGKALPTLAEGMQSFESLDGGRLKAAGEGIFELGKGLAVFAVGGAAAGVGGVLGAVGDGITSFFGGKTPFQKLEEFSKLNIDAEKVKVNAQAFAEFSKALAVMGGAGATGGIGAILEGIGTFLGGKTPFDKFVAFSKLDIDSTKIATNADAFVAFSHAMAQFSGGKTIVAGIGTIVQGVGTFFGGKTPFDRFVAFSKLDIDSTKVATNANAFVAFSTAMAQFPGGKDIVGSVGSMISGIASFFGGKSPVEKLQQFANLDINADGVTRNSQAFVTFSENMLKLNNVEIFGPKINDGMIVGLRKIGSIGNIDAVKAHDAVAKLYDAGLLASQIKLDSFDVSKLKISGADLSQTNDIVNAVTRINAAMGQSKPGMFQAISDKVSKFANADMLNLNSNRVQNVRSNIMNSPSAAATTTASAMPGASTEKTPLELAIQNISSNQTKTSELLTKTLSEKLDELNTTMKTLVLVEEGSATTTKRVLAATREAGRNLFSI
jgi:hypothetical protein